jgi:hypothetical protein
MINAAPLTASTTHACVTCGGAGTWHPGRQQLICSSCGSAIAVPPGPPGAVTGFDLMPLLADRPDSGRDWKAAATQVRCTACQTVMKFEPGVSGRNCEACGSPALVPCHETGAPVSPSGVLPFRITEADARTHLSAWFTTLWMFPRAHERPVIDTVRAVYLPCWTFSARVHCRWRGEITRTRNGETRTVAIDGVIDSSYDDYLVPAARSLPWDLLESIEPFPMPDVAVYDTRYLAGSIVELYAVNMWDAWDTASQRMQDELNAELKADSKCRPEALETWPKWSDQRAKHLLVPVYMVTYQHGARTFEAGVNGCTGEVAGTRPRDVAGEIVAWALLLTFVGAVIYGIAWFFGLLG